MPRRHTAHPPPAKPPGAAERQSCRYGRAEGCSGRTAVYATPTVCLKVSEDIGHVGERAAAGRTHPDHPPRLGGVDEEVGERAIDLKASGRCLGGRTLG